MPVADESVAFQHRRHHSLSWDLEQSEVPFQYVKLSMLWDDKAPPENALQGLQNRVLSEHELRVQRSLQQLNVPDWYKNSARPAEGFLLKRGSADAGGQPGTGRVRSAGGWPGLGVKTTSLSSLRSPTTAVRLGSSPSPPPAAFTRWSSSRLAGSCNATPSTSPCGSARSSFNHRQPYLGWRSQERLSGTPRTPAERLAQGLLEQREQQRLQQRLRPNGDSSQAQSSSPNLSDVRSSIKEVTSAIVHYVSAANGPGSSSDVRVGAPAASNSDLRGGHPSASTGSTPRVCWIESSFVGSRPIEQPQTPDESVVSTSPLQLSHQDLYLDLKDLKQRPSPLGHGHGPHNGPHQNHGSTVTSAACAARPTSPSPTTPAVTALHVPYRPSPSSTTMEDVLDSLLGLPPPSRSPSPGPAQQQGHPQAQGHPAGHAAGLRSCADIRPDPAGSASDGCPPAWEDVVEHQENGVDGPDEPAGWEASDLVATIKGVATRPSPSGGAALPGWGDPGGDGPAPPPTPRPPGWRGTAVVSVVAEEGAEEAEGEAQFAAAVLTMPLDPAPPGHRRRSESCAEQGALQDDPRGSRRRAARPRRVSFDLGATGAGCAGGAGDAGVVACRRYGCGRVVERPKSCHNCAHTYCSRECRREHWEAHKRACAVRRVGGLLRRVVAKVRGDTAAISVVARWGFERRGRGAVRLLFHSTDAAEAYAAGEAEAGDVGQELVYVRRADLPAEELGWSLYEDVNRLCHSYNPATRAVTLVVLEVLSEAPSDDGVVMWERQLISRVFRVHLFAEDEQDFTIILLNAVIAEVTERPVVLRNIVRAVSRTGVDLRDEEHADALRRVQEYMDQGIGREDVDGIETLVLDVKKEPGGRVFIALVADPASDMTSVANAPDYTELVDVGFNQPLNLASASTSASASTTASTAASFDVEEE
ncbi:uncharacterized protein LOC113213438 isoform X2 [Frankliniella occidentalis]|uniref:Uncharacterized protein LOC113213438 isoform X2 n=1 Tax=Frankliniella occidentalis TaxID=133901 RepID=A0A9C6X1L1_FRAOC|nr:uncharacterized protein LOC113213438 isoform X2 [Frankliniella occidentalis]